MTYTVKNGIDIVTVSVKDFKIIMVNERKKSAAKKNYANAGFFAGFNEGSEVFTLPVAHLVCDYDCDGKWIKHYCNERGKFNGNKFTFDSANWEYMNPFYKKALSTLIITNGLARIDDVISIGTQKCDYAITGVPIMRDGKDVKFATYVRRQGWDGSTLYGTRHIFVGIKSSTDKNVYVMGMKTTSGNMITTAEAYRKFKALGFYDVIKLDGGGSFYMNINGTKKYTAENRRINTIITFGDIGSSNPSEPSKPSNDNPFPIPTRTLVKGRTGNDVKWLQFQLNKAGFGKIPMFSIDGSFGLATQTAVRNFQKAKGLAVDGSVGPATRARLKEI